MKNLEQQVNEAVDNNLEFQLLDDYCMYTTGEIAHLDTINYVLDLYNHYTQQQDTYYAKVNALILTVKQIEEDTEE